MWKNPWTSRIVFVACLLPLVYLGWRWYNHDLTANRLEYVARFTGRWTMRFLIASLAITPLRRMPGLNPLIGYRRMLGLFAFFYGVLHMLHYIVIDLRFDWLTLLDDLTYRRFFIAGMIALALMVPLAITSTKSWIRRLGKNWQRLHNLVYLSALAATVHYVWQWKAISIPSLYYPAVMVLLLLARVVLWANKKIARRKPKVAVAA
jgi:sulfoxide reductase heme-binding subunit YedZ